VRLNEKCVHFFVRSGWHGFAFAVAAAVLNVLKYTDFFHWVFLRQNTEFLVHLFFTATNEILSKELCV
jgi:hypothetical protein